MAVKIQVREELPIERNCIVVNINVYVYRPIVIVLDMWSSKVKYTFLFYYRFRQGFIRVFCCCPCAPCKRARSTIRYGRTLFPAGQYTVTEKYDRNGSMMHTMTDYVDESTAAVTRKDKKGQRDSDDYL